MLQWAELYAFMSLFGLAVMVTQGYIILKSMTKAALQAARIVQLEKEVAVQTALACTDPLTGLENERLFERRFADEIKRADRFGRSLSLLFLDVDKLNDINTKYGHKGGDSALRIVADALRGTIRSVDAPFRLHNHGDEFAVLLPETSGEAALEVAEKIRLAVCAKGGEYSVTTSIGVAVYPDDGTTTDELITVADNGMYSLKLNRKKGGKRGDGVCHYSED